MLSVWVNGWPFFLQTISQDWEGLRTLNLAQRWRLVRGWCAKNEQISLHMLRQKPQIVEMLKLVNIGHGVTIMPELFLFKLCTALIFNCGKISSQNWQTLKTTNFFPLAWWRHVYAETAYTIVQVDSPHATSDGVEHWGPCDNSHLTCLISPVHRA